MDKSESRDPLTGLYDLQEARETITAWKRDWPRDASVCPIHAMLISLGRIDNVNVAFGESAGDGALVEAAQRIRHFAEDELESSVWFAARLNGGNFLLANREECSRERWQWLGEALADALASPFANTSGGAAVRMWPRVALMRVNENDDSASVLDRLSEVVTRMRQENVRRIDWSSHTPEQTMRSSHELEADLLAAIDNDEIEIRYQPLFSLPANRLAGGEALARWHHPTVGRIGASTLFQIAERADHVAHLSRHIAERAMEGARDWPSDLKLSLNITSADLSVENFAVDFARLAERIGFPMGQIALEITEQALVPDLERVAQVLDQLRMMGARIALDDFGAGFCNFSYLKVLPLDCIKLDRTMIDGVLDDPRDQAIFRAITGVAKALDLCVIVEGIETEAQRDFCAAEQCQFYQGFLTARPLLAEDFRKLAG